MDEEVSIYCLHTDGLIWYVGQTTDTVRRESKHRASHVKGRWGGGLIPDLYEWEMKILEKCKMIDAVIRERHYYDILKPLYNKIRPGGHSDAEYAQKYRDTHKDDIKEYTRSHRTNNLDGMLEYERKYRDMNRERIRAYQREYAKQRRINAKI